MLVYKLWKQKMVIDREWEEHIDFDKQKSNKMYWWNFLMLVLFNVCRF